MISAALPCAFGLFGCQRAGEGSSGASCTLACLPSPLWASCMSSSRLKPTWSAAFELAGQRWRLALTSTAAASLSTNDRPLLPMLNRAAGSQVRSPGLIFSANSAALLQAARTPSQGSSQNFCRSFSGRPAAAGLAQLGISSRLKSTVCAAGRRDTSRQQQSFRLQSISVVCETNRCFSASVLSLDLVLFYGCWTLAKSYL